MRKYIHPNIDEAKAFKLHSLTVRLVVEEYYLELDLKVLFSRQVYGLHLYRRSRYFWLPFWKEDWISVLDKDDLITLNLAITGFKDSSFNIGQMTNLSPSPFMFFTENELNVAEPLIKKAIKLFLDKVISRGASYHHLRIFHRGIMPGNR